MCIMSFLVVYFACHFSKNVFVYNATCTMFIVQLFIKCSSFIGGIKVKVYQVSLYTNEEEYYLYILAQSLAVVFGSKKSDCKLQEWPRCNNSEGDRVASWSFTRHSKMATKSEIISNFNITASLCIYIFLLLIYETQYSNSSFGI